jgi:REP element-mobilizing transposase RayT
MASPLRLEFAGALYHVTARGNDRRAIFLGELETDRSAFLDTLAQTVERFNWVCPAYR